MIHPLSLSRVERYWAKEFGCSTDTLLAPSGSKVFVRSNDSGALIFRYHECCIWHVPERFASAVQRSVQPHAGVDAVFNEAFIAARFGAAARLILGPASLAYCDDSTLRRNERLPPCRRLTKDDAAAVARLAIACGPEDWERGGVDFDAHAAVFGCFDSGELVAVASYEVWGNEIGHVCLVTAPSHRGRGFAKSVGTAATVAALDQCLVPQWRTLASNAPSVSVSRAIGFERVAKHYFVRLAVG